MNADRKGMPLLQISVIIPTFNRKDKLQGLLRSLCNQAFDSRELEVLIVDDGSTDGTGSMVEEFTSHCRLRYVKMSHGGQGAARNKGASLARAGILLFLDDDLRASDQLLEHHYRMHRNEERIMVMGLLVPRAGTGLLNERLLKLNYKDYSDGQELEFNAISANLSIKRVHFIAGGGYDEDLPVLEDTELGFRLFKNQGLKLIFSRKAMAYHDRTLTVADYARSQFLSGKTMLTLLRQNPAIGDRRFSQFISSGIMEHFRSTESFRPLTGAEISRVMASIRQCENRYRKKPSDEAREKLWQACDIVETYPFSEGFYVERQKLGYCRSLFEERDLQGGEALTRRVIRLRSTASVMSGYGRQAGSLYGELSRRGFRFHFEPLDPVPERREERVATLPPESPGRERDSLCISLSPPYAAKKKKGSCNVLYCTYETDRIPGDWVTIMNRFDEIWAFSTFNSRAFAESGVTRPIHVMPAGLNERNYTPSSGNPFIVLPGQFIFLSIGSFYHYKGFDILLKAYLQEFSALDDVCLVIKTYTYFGPPQRGAAMLVEELKRKTGRRNPPAVMVIENVFIDPISRLFGSAHAYVSTSRGEGFCLPLLEAMASGVPVIATFRGGQADYLTEDNAFPVNYTLSRVRPNDHPFHQLGTWAEADVEHVRFLMRHVYENRGEAIKKARQGRKDFLARWTRRHMGQKMEDRIRELCSGKS